MVNMVFSTTSSAQYRPARTSKQVLIVQAVMLIPAASHVPAGELFTLTRVLAN
jgi:hypothetical protein